MLGKMKGWDFTRTYSADGSSTLETLTAEKKRLQTRLLEIPKIIPTLVASLNRAKRDIAWLKELKSLKRKRWENEKGTTVELAVHKYEQSIVKNTGRIISMRAEQKQIPIQIKAIQTQLDTLVKGESVGLEKGLDNESAKALGELELQKEKERLAHERAIREAELIAETKRQELQAEKDKEAMADQAKSGKFQKRLFIGIGITLLLIVGGIIFYKRKLAKTAA